jgi:hypothetical protein
MPKNPFVDESDSGDSSKGVHTCSGGNIGNSVDHSHISDSKTPDGGPSAGNHDEEVDVDISLGNLTFPDEEGLKSDSRPMDGSAGEEGDVGISPDDLPFPDGQGLKPDSSPMDGSPGEESDNEIPFESFPFSDERFEHERQSDNPSGSHQTHHPVNNMAFPDEQNSDHDHQEGVDIEGEDTDESLFVRDEGQSGNASDGENAEDQGNQGGGNMSNHGDDEEHPQGNDGDNTRDNASGEASGSHVDATEPDDDNDSDVDASILGETDDSADDSDIFTYVSFQELVSLCRRKKRHIHRLKRRSTRRLRAYRIENRELRRIRRANNKQIREQKEEIDALEDRLKGIRPPETVCCKSYSLQRVGD